MVRLQLYAIVVVVAVVLLSLLEFTRLWYIVKKFPGRFSFHPILGNLTQGCKGDGKERDRLGAGGNKRRGRRGKGERGSFPFLFPSPPPSVFSRLQSLPSLPVPHEALGLRGWFHPCKVCRSLQKLDSSLQIEYSASSF